MLSINKLNYGYYNTRVNFKGKTVVTDYDAIRKNLDKIVVEMQDVIPPAKEIKVNNTAKTRLTRFKEWFFGLFSKTKQLQDPVITQIQQRTADEVKLEILPAGQNGWTELHYLCRDGYTDALKEFIKKHPNFDVNQRTKEGYSYIYLAEHNDNKEIVNMLAEFQTLDLSTKDKGGFNDLHFLCRDGYTNAVKKIIENQQNFDVNQRTHEGYSYMFLAEHNHNTEIVNMLAGIKSLDLSKTDKDGFNDMHFLCRDGFTEAVRRIINNHPKFNVNQRTHKSYSYIYLAEHNHNREIVNMLAGIKSLDLSSTDIDGFNDLHLLCRDDFPDAVKAIIDNHPNFDVNQLTHKGYSYMYLARHNNNTSIVNILAAYL